VRNGLWAQQLSAISFYKGELQIASRKAKKLFMADDNSSRWIRKYSADHCPSSLCGKQLSSNIFLIFIYCLDAHAKLSLPAKRTEI